MKVFIMGSKAQALKELEAVIKESGRAETTVGRQIAGDPGFMDRMRDPSKTVTTKTLDAINRYVLTFRHQLDLDLD